jgi:type VI secretion system protein ImpE
MNASDLFKAGRLQEAIDAQTQEVKANPGDPNRRLFLFELLAFAGDLDRARKQIDAVQYGEVELDAATLAYSKLLDAEQARRRLLKEGVAPKFLAEPPASARLRLEAANRLRENRAQEAADLLRQADDASPPLRGQLNGKPFDLLRDCDDLFGPVLEVMAHGEYYWVPLEQVAALTLSAPKHPRDLLWASARLEMRDGLAGNVFLPVLYHGSHESSDDQLRLGRKTEWKSGPGEPVLGVGVRMFLVGDEAVSLPEWRELEMSP